MGSFKEEEVKQQALDWAILQDGGIWLYRKPEALQADLDWLKAHRYELIFFDSASWHSESLMHDDLASALSFPSYYGKNLDALDECISEDLLVPDEGGMVLIFRRIERFTGRDVLLDIIANASRKHMLQGRRLIALLQTDDPHLNFPRLGGVIATWNTHEWLQSKQVDE